MSKRLIWGISALVLTAAVALGTWWIIGKSPEGVAVRAATVAPATIHQEVYATGTVVPIAKQEAQVLTPSKVSKVLVKVGDKVSVGQTLVELDTTLADAQVAQAQAGVNTAQANLNAAQANLELAKNPPTLGMASTSTIPVIQGIPRGDTIDIPLSESGNLQYNAASGINPVSSANLKQAEAAVSQAEAMLKQAQEGLKAAKAQRDQNIYKANIQGTVLEINATQGNPVSMQAPLIVVADLSKLRVEAQLNEIDAGKILIGQAVEASSKVIGETPTSGSVAEIAPQAVSKLSVQGNTPPSVRMLVDLKDIPDGLKPGYTVSLKVLTASKEGVLAVPQEALFQEGGKNYVFRVINNKLEKTQVSLGILNETLQEITSGLQTGEQVVSNPTSQMRHGMQVQVESGSDTL